MINLGVAFAGIEFAAVHLFAIGVHDERGHDLLRLLANTGDVKFDLFGVPVELDVEFVDDDVGVVLAVAVAVGLENISRQSTQGC